jgi:uroporphyrinogen decarboxylase
MFEQLANVLGLPSEPTELLPRQRIATTLEGSLPDRPPVCFWHHFQPQGSGRQLARATSDFFVREFDLDIVKVMPDLPYPFPQRSIQSIDDWRLIEPVDPQRSRWVQQQVECINALMEELLLQAPIVLTQFSPLTEALHFAQNNEQFFDHLRENPTVVHRALGTIAENLRAASEAVIKAGADGIFFALQGATTEVMPEAIYREVGLPYDLRALDGAQNGWLNILHLHGERDLLFDLAVTYPVQVLNWSDRIAGPSLREARSKTNLVLMGGWNEQGAIATGDETGIFAEALDAYEQTEGVRFILSPGCSIPDDTSVVAMEVARVAPDQLGTDTELDDDLDYIDEDDD